MLKLQPVLEKTRARRCQQPALTGFPDLPCRCHFEGSTLCKHYTSTGSHGFCRRGSFLWTMSSERHTEDCMTLGLLSVFDLLDDYKFTWSSQGSSGPSIDSARIQLFLKDKLQNRRQYGGQVLGPFIICLSAGQTWLIYNLRGWSSSMCQLCHICPHLPTSADLSASLLLCPHLCTVLPTWAFIYQSRVLLKDRN